MGQCVSCKTGKHRHFYTTSPTSRSSSRRTLTRMEAAVSQSEAGNTCTKRPVYSRGQATLFGFKRRPTSASPAVVSPPRSEAAATPDSGFVTPRADSHQHPPSTPRPSRSRRPGPPATTANRFGFRAPSAPPATNKVGDVNCTSPLPMSPPAHQRVQNSAPADSRPRPRDCSRLVAPTNYRMKSPDDNLRKGEAVRPNTPQPLPPTKFTLHTSLLPKPQFPVRLSSADADLDLDVISSKGAKTAANNTRKERREEASAVAALSSKEGSPTGDSGLGSAVSDTLQGLEPLDASPTFGRRGVPRRLLGTVVTGKFFDVRDLKDDDESLEDPNVITEISLISIPGTRVNHHPTGIVRERSRQLLLQRRRDDSSSVATSSDEGHEDEGLGDDDDDYEGDEEKAHRDRSSSEKVRSPPAASSAEEQLWGHGEAMAEGYTSSGDESPYSAISSFDNTTTTTTTAADVPLRPVLLTIEDCRFAAIAATAPDALIEDEKSPVDSVFSSSPPTSCASDPVDTSPAGQTAPVLSPETPGTPTNASNSLSLSEGRDFLIDDEIADQPGLTFDGRLVGGDTTSSGGGCSSQMASIVDSSFTLVDSSPRPVRKQDASAGCSPARGRRMVRAGSVDTLSPCESLASDDLMMDFDSSQGSLLDPTVGGSQADVSSGPIDNLDEDTLMSEIDAKCDSQTWEWSSPLGAQQRPPTARAGSVLRSRPSSTPDSPRSLDSSSRPIRSPLRLTRQLNGPSDADDSSVRLDRGTYQYMFQDIVSIKTMLLKLNRILQENEESGLTRAETLNPFDTSLKNGLFYSMTTGSEEGGAGACLGVAGEEVVDLRRQVVLLQSQLEDKERTIEQLQLKVTHSPETATATALTCNAATQTERIRPVSAGPSLLHSLPSEGGAGPLVSSSDKWRQRPVLEAQDLPASRLPTPKRGSLPNGSSAPEHSQPPTRKLSSSTLLRKMVVS